MEDSVSVLRQALLFAALVTVGLPLIVMGLVRIWEGPKLVKRHAMIAGQLRQVELRKRDLDRAMVGRSVQVRLYDEYGEPIWAEGLGWHVRRLQKGSLGMA
ncbi:hypothetical protein [Cupriavidus basilensis]|uniref:Uncharacterized protein n=1 Tax=Cupriavidus basilensis TaxID=68895 RepID=A0A643FSV4_9BURK|nr:hypothetical protein [Cupriavidus basilensis]QOT82209.1 hypothetical protein F7R26_039550 [Cupriavidus basilensis]